MLISFSVHFHHHEHLATVRWHLYGWYPKLAFLYFSYSSHSSDFVYYKHIFRGVLLFLFHLPSHSSLGDSFSANLTHLFRCGDHQKKEKEGVREGEQQEQVSLSSSSSQSACHVTFSLRCGVSLSLTCCESLVTVYWKSRVGWFSNSIFFPIPTLESSPCIAV